MEYLLKCPCGHPVPDHAGDRGCRNDACDCRRSEGAARMASIDEAVVVANAEVHRPRDESAPTEREG